MDARTPKPDRPHKSTTTGLPKNSVPTRTFKYPHLRRASYDLSHRVNVDIIQGEEQRRRSLSSLYSEDDIYTNPEYMCQ